jgi:hypothetical protein
MPFMNRVFHNDCTLKYMISLLTSPAGYKPSKAGEQSCSLNYLMQLSRFQRDHHTVEGGEGEREKELD